jgi:hypothetical protein
MNIWCTWWLLHQFIIFLDQAVFSPFSHLQFTRYFHEKIWDITWLLQNQQFGHLLINGKVKLKFLFSFIFEKMRLFWSYCFDTVSNITTCILWSKEVNTTFFSPLQPTIEKTKFCCTYIRPTCVEYWKPTTYLLHLEHGKEINIFSFCYSEDRKYRIRPNAEQLGHEPISYFPNFILFLALMTLLYVPMLSFRPQLHLGVC